MKLALITGAVMVFTAYFCTLFKVPSLLSPLLMTEILVALAIEAIRVRERASFELNRFSVVAWYSTCVILLFSNFVLLTWCGWFSAKLLAQ